MKLTKAAPTRPSDAPDADRVGRALDLTASTDVPSRAPRDVARRPPLLPLPVRQVIIREVVITDRPWVVRPVAAERA